MNFRLASSSLLASFIVFSIHAQNFGPFTERTGTGIPTENYTTAAFGDFNNDGFVDIATTRSAYTSTTNIVEVWKNNPDAPGTFSRVFYQENSSQTLAPERQLAWADFDNDGDLDLFANSGATSVSRTFLYRNSGFPDYTLELVRTGSTMNSDGILPYANNAQGAGWFDANQDGWLDLFNSSGSNQSKIYRNRYNENSGNPSMWFEDINHSTWGSTTYLDNGTTGILTNSGPNGSYSVTADINNDGRQDILYAIDQDTTDNRLYVWLNQTQKESPTLNFLEIGRLVLSVPMAPTTNDITWSGVIAWDADNDGDLDILFSNCNGLSGNNIRDLFYENTFGFNSTDFSVGNFTNKLVLNETVSFGDATPRRSGGVTAGDLTNNGWMDVYVVHGQPNTTEATDALYLHSGTTGLNASTYAEHAGATHGTYSGTKPNYANGVTFGDIDNDGDLDMFLCNGGRFFINNTNSLNKPADPRDNYYKDYPERWEPITDPKAEHYLDVMVSGASADETGKSKDGIGARVYVFKQLQPNHTHKDSTLYGKNQLIGMREIDGGSGYGSQATQIQHFGLKDNVSNPHKDTVCIKAVFLTGESLWKWGVIPDEVFVKIPHYDQANSEWDTTYLAQTVEVSLYDLRKPSIHTFEVHVEPNTTMPAGDTVTFWAELFVDDNGEIKPAGPEYTDQITWTPIIPSEVSNGSWALTKNNGDTTKFTATEAYTTYGVIAQLINPDSLTDTARDTGWVTIVPADTGALVIESSPTKPTERSQLVDPNPLARITLQNSETTGSAYAIFRDIYGNWIGPAAGAQWGTLNPSILTAAAASGSEGKGVVTRVANSGETEAVASKSAGGKTLRDSVLVVLTNVDYVELRFVDENTDVVTSLTMRADTTKLLYAEGRSTLGSWDRLGVAWFTQGLKINSDNPPPAQSNQWTIIPAGASSGTLGISFGSGSGSITHSIPVTFLLGRPNKLVIYDDTDSPYPDPEDPFNTLEIKAGTNQKLIAKIFDKFGDLIANYSHSDSILWKDIEQTGLSGTGILSPTNGDTVTYVPTVAFRTIRIAASHVPQGQTRALRDTVKFTINPGDPYRIVIESAVNAGTISPNDDNGIDTARIYGDQTQTEVYAVIRDQYGNYVSMSQATTWWEDDNSIIEVSAGLEDRGQGVVVRVGSGSTRIAATNTDRSLTVQSDTAWAKVVPYFYRELRIINGADEAIDSLAMTTNDDTTLYVEGLRSDTAIWEAVPAQWELSSGITTPQAPPKADQWTFSPRSDGAGWMRVYLDADTTVPDTVWLDIGIGKPQDVTIRVVANPDSLLAGNPLPAVIEIKNRWGRVPGQWCEDVSFDDLLSEVPDAQVDINGNTLVPGVIVDGDTIAFGETISDFCFQDGIASVDLLLYHAPLSNPAHEITVDLQGSDLQDTTDVVISPGPVGKIAIVENTDPVETFDGDSLLLRSSDAKVLKLVGYDEYGNLVGPVKGNWGTSGDIPSLRNPQNQLQVYYQVSDILYVTTGYIYTAYAKDITVVDSIAVTITPRPARITSAITRDYNGNGRLDAIELTFDKAVSFDSASSILNYFLITYPHSSAPNGTFRFTPRTISPLGSSDSSFVLYLDEDSTTLPEEPQTSWTPTIETQNHDDILSYDGWTTTDGAGPVIWRVSKVVNSTGDRTKDKVSVVISEDFEAIGGGVFSPLNLPAEVFNVWYLDSSGSYVQIDSMLVGIDNFSGRRGDTLIFYMSNGNELTGEHFLTIATDPTPPIQDKTVGNKPDEDNHEVRVIVQGTIGRIVVGPNPMIPVFAHDEPELIYQEPQEAFDWAQNEGGAVMVTDIVLSEDQNIKVKASLMVFDALGNLVYKRDNTNDVIPNKWREESWVPGATRQLVFYWNGITDRNRRSAPGIYRTIIYVDDGLGERKKFVGNVGIGR